MEVEPRSADSCKTTCHHHRCDGMQGEDQGLGFDGMQGEDQGHRDEQHVV